MFKRLKWLVLVAARSLGLFALARLLTRRAVRILCYHGLWTADDRYVGDALFMRPSQFQDRLRQLEAGGYPVVTLDAAIDGLQGRAELPACSVVITIDDGWRSTYTHMLPALESHRWPATLYCDSAHLEEGKPIAHVMGLYLDRLAGIEPAALSDQPGMATVTSRDLPMDVRIEALRRVSESIGFDIERLLESKAFEYMTPTELKNAAGRGLSIQLHTHRHTIHDGSSDAVSAEIVDNISALSRWTGQPADAFRHFCYPSGLTSAGAIVALRNAGIRSATTTVHGLPWPRDNLYLLPRFLDNGRLSSIEFEAEISGFMMLLRQPGTTLRRWSRHRVEPSVSMQASSGDAAP